MISAPVIIAQAVPAVPDVTLGQIISGLAVLGVIVCSLLMCSVWTSRWRQGIELIPRAARKPLCVPLPLLFCGLGLAVLMAVLAAFGGEEMTDGAEANAGANDAAANVGPTDASSEPPNEALTVKTPAVSSPSATTDIASKDDATGEKLPGNAVTDSDVKPKETPEESAARTAEQKQHMRDIMLGNINANLIVLMIFGLTIWATQKHRSRQVSHLEDVCYPLLSFPQQFSEHPTALERLPDLDSEIPTLPIPAFRTTQTFDTHKDLTNPYAFAGDAEASLSGFDATVAGERPVIEPWYFLTELRFAIETFLVAYFPTTAIRIAIVSALPDAPSHPFLKLLDEGVDWDIMLLIFLMAVVVAPVVEELLFRVTLLGGMLQRRHYVLGWVVSSVLFGMAHGFPDCIALLPLAFAIGYAYSRRRSYRTAMLVHFLFNAFNMLLAGLSML